MSRRNKAVKRPVPPDPRYDSQTVSKFVNNLMFEGKKSVAEGIFYSAMDMIEERTGQSYEDYCREAVFAKLGIAAPHLHPDWRMLSGAGGWYLPGRSRSIAIVCSRATPPRRRSPSNRWRSGGARSAGPWSRSMATTSMP